MQGCRGDAAAASRGDVGPSGGGGGEPFASVIGHLDRLGRGQSGDMAWVIVGQERDGGAEPVGGEGNLGPV